SNILNLLVVLPFPGLIRPGGFDPSLLYRDYVTMLILSLLLTIMCFRAVRRGSFIGRSSGIFLILVYLAWVLIMYWQL
ncbi:MAG: calcium/sodium antiporter, partial [Pseudomonadota bacterium]